MKNRTPSIPISTAKPAEKQVNQRIRPGVKALIVHNGKILVITEKTSRGIIHDFPGGGIEYGESIIESLVREVKEEINVDVKPIKPVGAWSFILDEWNVHILCIGYQCELLGSSELDFTKNSADENIFEAHWYTKEELLTQNILSTQEMKDAVALVEI